MKNSVSYLPTFINSIQVAIEFTWVDYSLHNTYRRAIGQARRTRHFARSPMLGEEKITNIFGNTYLKPEFQTYLTTLLASL